LLFETTFIGKIQPKMKKPHY